MNGRRIRWVISGGIGSGKTAVRRILADHGFATIDADKLGHKVIEPDGPAFSQVTARWPEVVVDGRIDRASLAQIVFANEGELRELEAITHPHIFGMIQARVEGIEDPVAVEIPVLAHDLGAGWSRLVVDCDEPTRLARAMARGLAESDARLRMEMQPPRAVWLSRADIVVPNHGELGELTLTVNHLAVVV